MTRSPRWRALPFLFVMMTSAASAQILKGAGATFPHPLYQAWLAEYQKGSDTRISYDAVGSGEGIRRLKDYWVDFGASDKYLTTEEMRELPLPLLHVPTCLGAVVLIYNLPGNPPLRLTPAAISGIFLGEIKYWNDEIIQRTNPDAVLPATKIKAIQRSDGSGTTYIFTNYLSKVSAVWKKKYRNTLRAPWPSGMAVRYNEGVIRFVEKISGSVGYVELTFARESHLPVAAVANRAGDFVAPSTASVAAAASIEVPVDARVMLTDTAIAGAYPIVGFTYLMAFLEQNYGNRSRGQAEALNHFLLWTLGPGQDLVEGRGYVPLPEMVREKARQVVGWMMYDNERLGVALEKMP